jgi:hypothetical protein
LPGVEERDNQQIKAVRATLNGKKKSFCVRQVFDDGPKRNGTFLFFSFLFFPVDPFFPGECVISRLCHTHTHTSGSFSSSWPLATLLSADLSQ